MKKTFVFNNQENFKHDADVSKKENVKISLEAYERKMYVDNNQIKINICNDDKYAIITVNNADNCIELVNNITECLEGDNLEILKISQDNDTTIITVFADNIDDYNSVKWHCSYCINDFTKHNKLEVNKNMCTGLKKTIVFKNTNERKNYEYNTDVKKTLNRVLITDTKDKATATLTCTSCKKITTAIKHFISAAKEAGYYINTDDIKSSAGTCETGDCIYLKAKFSKPKQSGKTQNIDNDNTASQKENNIPFYKGVNPINNDKEKILKKLDFLEKNGFVNSVGYGLKIFDGIDCVYDDKTNSFKIAQKDIGFFANIINPTQMVNIGGVYNVTITDEVYKLPNIIVDWVTLNTISIREGKFVIIYGVGTLDTSDGSLLYGNVDNFKKILKEINVEVTQTIKTKKDEYCLVYDAKTVKRGVDFINGENAR